MNNLIVDSLKAIVINAGIVSWAYFVTMGASVIIDLNILPRALVGLAYILLLVGGSLYIIIKMRDFFNACNLDFV